MVRGSCGLILIDLVTRAPLEGGDGACSGMTLLREARPPGWGGPVVHLRLPRLQSAMVGEEVAVRLSFASSAGWRPPEGKAGLVLPVSRGHSCPAWPSWLFLNQLLRPRGMGFAAHPRKKGARESAPFYMDQEWEEAPQRTFRALAPFSAEKGGQNTIGLPALVPAGWDGN